MIDNASPKKGDEQAMNATTDVQRTLFKVTEGDGGETDEPRRRDI